MVKNIKKMLQSGSWELKVWNLKKVKKSSTFALSVYHEKHVLLMFFDIIEVRYNIEWESFVQTQCISDENQNARIEFF